MFLFFKVMTKVQKSHLDKKYVNPCITEEQNNFNATTKNLVGDEATIKEQRDVIAINEEQKNAEMSNEDITEIKLLYEEICIGKF